VIIQLTKYKRQNTCRRPIRSFPFARPLIKMPSLNARTVFAVRVCPPVPTTIGIVRSIADNSLRVQHDDVVHLSNFVVSRVAHENVADFASVTILNVKVFDTL
jgi:hypothetical protein